jgi:hypothetical protein
LSKKKQSIGRGSLRPDKNIKSVSNVNNNINLHVENNLAKLVGE